MTQEEIIEGNKLIAEFMGLHFHKIGWVDKYHIDGNYECERLDYYGSWDWLMPVVEKIEIDCTCDVHIYGHYNWKESNRCSILDWKDNEIVSKSNDSKSQCVFDAVIEFIKWYNETQNGKN